MSQENQDPLANKDGTNTVQMTGSNKTMYSSRETEKMGIHPDEVNDEVDNIPFEPLYNWLVIPHPEVKETEGGIVLPDGSEKKHVNKLTVLKAGDDCKGVSTGDYVLINPKQGILPVYSKGRDKEFCFIKETDVVCKLDPSEE